MATRAWESAVLPFAINTVWTVIRPLTFAWSPNVILTSVKDKKSRGEVGAIICIEYKDTTKQRIRMTELSDATHTVSWEVIESEPSIPVMSAVHTVSLRRVTEDNTTFVEWTTDFSKDVDVNTMEDARFKQKDHFDQLRKFLSPTADGKQETTTNQQQRIGLVYDPMAARQQVLTTYQELKALHSHCVDSSAENKVVTANSLSLAETKAAILRYKTFPITYQINWEVADVSSAAAQVLADQTRNALNELQTRHGSNALPLPHLFNGNAAE